MSKRPALDLMALTADQAQPMAEATQRVPAEVTKLKPEPASSPTPKRSSVKTEDLEALAFKVPPAFRKRFRQRAVNADLKQNELLFEALDAWEEKHRLK